MSDSDGRYIIGDAESALQYLHRDVSRDERASVQVHEDTAEAIEFLKNQLNAGAETNVTTADDAIRLAILALSRYHQYSNNEKSDVTEERILDEVEELTMGLSHKTQLHGELGHMSEELARDPTNWIPDEVPKDDVEDVIDTYFDNPEKYKEWPGFRRRTNDRGRL